MQITVWRHGEAGSAVVDADRPLTPRGHQTVAEAAENLEKWLAANGEQPGVCRHSPLLRTTETAAVLARQWPGMKIEACPALAPGADPARSDSYLAAAGQALVLVGHQPFVSMLLAFWLDDTRLPTLMPGGHATVELIAPTRGGARLLHAVPALW